MQPIVDRFQEMYNNEVQFVYLNARDDGRAADSDHTGMDGEALFEQLVLPGHPAFVIFTPDGEEQYRSFGIVEEDELTDALNNVRADVDE